YLFKYHVYMHSMEILLVAWILLIAIPISLDEQMLRNMPISLFVHQIYLLYFHIFDLHITGVQYAVIVLYFDAPRQLVNVLLIKTILFLVLSPYNQECLSSHLYSPASQHTLHSFYGLSLHNSLIFFHLF